jgi:hypothetical protein
MSQDVSQIEKEFLIRTIVQSERPVRFHGVSTTGTGLITMMDRSMLSVTLTDTLEDRVFCTCERITGYFDCRGSTYAFETTVRDMRQNELRLDPPGRLLRNPQRKYVRIRKPRGIQVTIQLQNEDIHLDYPVCPDYLNIDENMNDAEYTAMNFMELIGSFKNGLSGKCSKNTIVMFRTKKPESFEENLISKTGKVLFVPSTGSGLPKADPYPGGRIIAAKQEEAFEDPNYFIVGSRFEKILLEKKSKGISSEI